MGLEVGDEVIVHKPNNPDEYPTWVDDMDEYDGRVVKIATIYSDSFGIYGATFTFSPNWIEYQAPDELNDVEPDISELM
jgi:hypothetical protein